LAVAWNALDLTVFIPSTSSWFSFFALGGRPAWYLIGIASLVAAFRKRIGKNWKLFHYLNYLAFWLATVHGILIGANVQNVVMRALFVLLAVVVLGVFLPALDRPFEAWKAGGRVQLTTAVAGEEQVEVRLYPR